MSLATRGAFIVLEGIDRTGKTTQVKKLTDYLTSIGHKSVAMRFPDRSTTIGTMIGDYLQKSRQLDDHVIHLLFSANRWEAKETILKHLSEGTTVVCDRYAYSGAAFTAAKGYDLDWCMAPDKGLPRPDMVLYLDISIDVVLQRGGFGNEVYETEAIQTKVKSIYEDQMWDPSYWVSVNANQSIDEVHSEISSKVSKKIDELTKSPLPTPLWTKM